MDYVLLYLIAGLVVLITGVGRAGPFDHPSPWIVLGVHTLMMLLWPVVIVLWAFIQ